MASDTRTGRKTAIRLSRLTVGGHGSKTLHAAELHGKRLDASSQSRQVSKKPPVVHGGLDLEQLFTAHAEGCKMDKRTRSPVIHALVQWPTGLQVNEANERAMLAHATKFMNLVFGGEAVFAARLDRDEAGKHAVDVFLSPITTKTSAKGVSSRWIQPSAHLKALCHKHKAEIIRRHPTIKPKNIDNKRCQGIALQSEWRAYVEDLGITLDAKREKGSSAPDRLSPEEYALMERKKALEAREAAVAEREAAIEALPALAKEAMALLSGDETPSRMDERHHDERAESDDGVSTWEDLWPMYNAHEPKNTPSYWKQLREHVIEFWREKIKRFGLEPSNDAGFRPN
jgi:hypothetical protein